MEWYGMVWYSMVRQVQHRGLMPGEGEVAGRLGRPLQAAAPRRPGAAPEHLEPEALGVLADPAEGGGHAHPQPGGGHQPPEGVGGHRPRLRRRVVRVEVRGAGAAGAAVAPAVPPHLDRQGDVPHVGGGVQGGGRALALHPGDQGGRGQKDLQHRRLLPRRLQGGGGEAPGGGGVVEAGGPGGGARHRGVDGGGGDGARGQAQGGGAALAGLAWTQLVGYGRSLQWVIG